jgi:hypothetical protein
MVLWFNLMERMSGDVTDVRDRDVTGDERREPDRAMAVRARHNILGREWTGVVFIYRRARALHWYTMAT